MPASWLAWARLLRLPNLATSVADVLAGFVIVSQTRAVDWLLIWIPLSRISHFMFYFFAKAIHGAQFGKRAVAP